MSLTASGPEVIARRLYRTQRVYTPLPNIEAFDEQAVRRYREDGFIAIENVFTPEEVQAGKDGICKIIEDGNPKTIQFEEAGKNKNLSIEERAAFVRKCMYFVEPEPRLKAMSDHPRMHHVLHALMGSDMLLLQDMALLKPPHIGREKPWHQDSAYFMYGPANLIVGTWTALDNATPENGCMHVIPGTHHAGGRAHYHDRDCQLPDETVDVEQVVVVPLKPGGVLFFSSLLHHGTPPNSSAQRRWAVQFHYRSVHSHELNAEEYRQMFRDSKGVAGCLGQYGDEIRPVSSREL